MNIFKTLSWVLFLILMADYCVAGTISVSWEPLDSAEWYSIYVAEEPGGYENGTRFEVGNVTSTVISGLADCTDYFIAVKGVNSTGESMEYSDAVTGWARPVVTTRDMVVTTQGDRITLALDGFNFMPGADLRVEGNPGVVVESVGVQGCDHLVGSITVEPTASGIRPAQIGDFEVSVINPDSVFGSSGKLLEVKVNRIRFDINQQVESSCGRVDGQDTLWMLRQFGADEADPLYQPDYDLDGDGWIDGNDLAYLASVFGCCWDGTDWSAAACH